MIEFLDSTILKLKGEIKIITALEVKKILIGDFLYNDPKHYKKAVAEQQLIKEITENLVESL